MALMVAPTSAATKEARFVRPPIEPNEWPNERIGNKMHPLLDSSQDQLPFME